jgi:DNA-directed RNA polymerase specialized sigma24 family protein
LALHSAIERLHATRPEVAELVKLRYFAGMTSREAAECLEISPRTADNYWAYAKVFLLKAMEADR